MKEKLSTNLASNIYSQAESLAGALRHHAGAGADAMAEAARLLRSGRKVVITAMGASLFASIPLQYHLCAHGLDAVSIEAGELLHYMEGAWNDAVFLVVSRSGESVEIGRLLERLKGRVPVIGVTNVPDSQLARYADIALSMASLPDEIVAVQTYAGTLLTLHLLGNAVTDVLADAAEEAAKHLPALNSLVEASMHSIEEWNGFLRPESPVYLLARGPSLGSAQEGALLFHETAKNAAVAMPIASFRHGPVEVVDANFRGLLFVPQDATRDLNLALARDLVAFGAQIRLIGPADLAAAIAPWCNIPDCSATLAPLFQIVPVQVAAYQMAVMRGVAPGSFRFAPQVAVDEASFSTGGGTE